MAQGADAYVHFLGRRERHGDGAVLVDVVHAVQYQTGRPLTEWRSLGNPHRSPERAARLGPPTTAVTPSGDVHVFARNAGGGLMMRREGRSGAWEPWADLRGAGLRDEVTATAVAGRVEVFAPAGGATLMWSQPEPGAVPRRLPDVRPGALPGSAAALETAPGRLTWFWTDPAGAGLVCLRPGAWAVPLSGAPADGSNVLLRQVLDGYDCTVIAHRGRDGTVLVGVCGTEAEASGLWWGTPGGPVWATRPWRTTPTAGPCSPPSVPTGTSGWRGRARAPGCPSRTGCGCRRDPRTRIRQRLKRL